MSLKEGAFDQAAPSLAVWPDHASVIHWMRKRDAISQRRASGAPQPWTDDEILATWSLCNVRREDDRVTRWVRTHIREPYAEHPNLWLMLCIGRLFNLPDTLAELIAEGAWPLEEDFDARAIARVAQSRTDRGQTNFSTAYISTVPQEKGASRHKRAAEIIDRLWQRRRVIVRLFSEEPCSLRCVHGELNRCDGLGGRNGFLANQMVVGMRFTRLLRHAADVSRWAAAGPGTLRGLNRIHNRPVTAKPSQDQALKEMQRLYAAVREQFALDFSDIPNVLCETDKYLRAKLCQDVNGKPSKAPELKNRFTPNSGDDGGVPVPKAKAKAKTKTKAEAAADDVDAADVEAPSLAGESRCESPAPAGDHEVDDTDAEKAAYDYEPEPEPRFTGPPSGTRLHDIDEAPTPPGKSAGCQKLDQLTTERTDHEQRAGARRKIIAMSENAEGAAASDAPHEAMSDAATFTASAGPGKAPLLVPGTIISAAAQTLNAPGLYLAALDGVTVVPRTATVDAPADTAAAKSFEVTGFRTAQGRITKRVELDGEGNLKIDGAPTLWRGNAWRVRYSSLADFAEALTRCPSNEAFGLGQLIDGLEDEVDVVTIQRLDGGGAPDASAGAPSSSTIAPDGVSLRSTLTRKANRTTSAPAWKRQAAFGARW